MYRLFVLAVFLTFISCTGDTDFSQAEDIELRPIMEVDLIYFNLQGNQFYDTETSTEILTVRDTTNLLFLDDEFVRDTDSISFYFAFNNTIPRTFDSNFLFYSQDDELFYTISATVEAGASGDAVETIYTETLAGDNILLLSEASKVVSEITIPSSNSDLGGVLQLRSKATFYLVFD